MEIVRLNATNDSNGNPRRVFIAINDGIVENAWEEGYRGKNAIPEAYRDKWRGVTFMTTPAEYREILRVYREERAS